MEQLFSHPPSPVQELRDPVYTGKLLFGVFDLAEKRFFPKGSTVR